MNKKIMVLLLLIGSIFLLAGCNNKKPPTEDDTDTPIEENPKVKLNYEYVIKGNLGEIATSYADLINEHLRSNQGTLYDNNHQTVKPRANLWSYGAYFTMASQLYNVERTSVNKARYDQALEELEWYRSLNRPDDHLVYASKNGDEIPPFYDDNVWLVIGLIKGYTTTEDESQLDKAKKIMAYIYDGWQEDEVGGLFWREYNYNEITAKEFEGKDDRNTCINGPAAWASLLLYEITGDATYLTWGIRLYNWTKDKLYDRITQTYSDNIKANGRVDTKKWTYNTGTMLSSAAILYKLTGSEFYKTDVDNLMTGSKSFIEPYSVVPNGEFYRPSDDNPWFRVYLVQGYLDAFRYVDYNYGVRLEHIKNAFTYANQYVKDDKGFIKADWSGRYANEYPNQKTLDQAGNAELISILAEYEQILLKVAE
ncbi:glycoside hydrolase family 76 protein [Acholeplasma vituli]|uniref:Glycoside hydrolase family 76 protein n=1 Tax=Paracholeplasma vituli TaxID=69473 RepID=A0ABT2PWJ3_9MOLU|nr:glycoside hydrolase family 76 protein [Paracholeplasma vituli]MCU0104117.1 glycoside hydrolase family 76 protein [Paracholeplasma vituli]